MEVSFEDVSHIIQLVREVCDRWDDPAAWREHLLRGACALLKGNVGTMFDTGYPTPGRFAEVRPIAIFGLPSPEKSSLVHGSTATVSHRDVEDVSQNFLPGADKLWDEFRRQGWVTAARDELTDIQTYRASSGYLDFRKHADCDDYIWSMRLVDIPARIEMLGVDRPHGAAPFSANDVMLLKLLHNEIAPLIGVRLATEEHFCRDGLSKRLRAVLTLLLDGKSEKEVANALELSPRTVHEYVSSIYRHFSVTSRAELLSYFIHRTPKPRPAPEPLHGNVL